MTQENEQCEHNNWHIESKHPLGTGMCDDCNKLVHLFTLFEGMRKRLQALLDVYVKPEEQKRGGSRNGIFACSTKPYCFGGKESDQTEPEVTCAVIGSMCHKSPNQQMAK